MQPLGRISVLYCLALTIYHGIAQANAEDRSVLPKNSILILKQRLLMPPDATETALFADDMRCIATYTPARYYRALDKGALLRVLSTKNDRRQTNTFTWNDRNDTMDERDTFGENFTIVEVETVKWKFNLQFRCDRGHRVWREYGVVESNLEIITRADGTWYTEVDGPAYGYTEVAVSNAFNEDDFAEFFDVFVE